MKNILPKHTNRRFNPHSPIYKSCIPHLDSRLNHSPVKYRLCESLTGGLCYTSHKNTLPILCGIDCLLTRVHTALLVVEGEINQLSILQVLCEHAKSRPGMSVVSTRSEGLNPKQAALLRWAARHY